MGSTSISSYFLAVVGSFLIYSNIGFIGVYDFTT